MARARWTSPLTLAAATAVMAVILGPFAAAASAAPAAPAASATPPSAPQNVVAVAGDSQVTISWEAPESDGGSPISFYTVHVDAATIDLDPTRHFCDLETGTSCTIPGLTNGVEYVVVVYATNDASDVPGPPSAPVTFIPSTEPDAPDDVIALVRDRSGEISWTAPENDGGSPIAFYTAAVVPGLQFCTATTGTRCTITGLTNGETYYAIVTATNAAGHTGLAGVSERFIPKAGASPPRAPYLVGTSPGPGSAYVAWIPPLSNGGLPITSYTATAYPGGESCDARGEEFFCMITGLDSSRTYTAVVTATNAAGTGRGRESAAFTVGWSDFNPGPVRKVTVTVKGPTATVSWRPPSDTGKWEGVTDAFGYNVRIGTGRKWSKWEPIFLKTEFTATGIQKSRKYKVQITAVNFFGFGRVTTVSFRG